MRFCCRNIYINRPEALLAKGPMIIAANHPNSFLDAIILSVFFHHPIYSLARGDAFANKLVDSLLRSLNMLPVYRQSEGAENLEHNYTTFNECINIFKRKGIVLIFSEGLCVNEWHLRPLKKGTARLAINAWQQNINLSILPVGINYSSFKSFGKNVILNFGDVITAGDLNINLNEGEAIKNFNLQLHTRLRKLVIEINKDDKEKIKRKFYVHQSLIKKILLFVPAFAGWLLHVPLYLPLKLLIKNRSNDHFDSIIIGLLFLLYPFYVLLISLIITHNLQNNFGWLSMIVLPFTAWSYLQLKRQFS